MKNLALVSVSDKTKIMEFVKGLVKNNFGIIATGNTAKKLKEGGIEVTEISDITAFPEIFDGRVKTLHPKIFGGILFRRENKSDQKQADENEITPINVVCVNLYPFVKTVENPDSTREQIIENIDIGGPSLIRASAKNYNYVSVLTSPDQYDDFLDELDTGNISDETRQKLAADAFSHTAFYDTYIANYLEKEFKLSQTHIRINYPKEKELRYGENPHQKAAIYGNFQKYFEPFHGKELSYNNILDLVAAVELVEDLGETSCAIIKHNNPAGASTRNTLLEAYLNALKGDPVSAFGGIVTFTSTIDVEVAEKLNEIFLEIVCAPSFTDEAIKILMKKRDRRLLKQLRPLKGNRSILKNIPGGIIAQDVDDITVINNKLKIVSQKKPANDEMEDLLFAWKIAKHTRSNAIVFAKDKAALGVGAGQMSRLDSSKLAKMKAEEHGLDLTNSVAASDAFFPFADGLEEIIKCGATAVIQPGGSVRDAEVIDAANKHNISMVFTGIRHFKH
ncbi:MAG TPA: bifunctional phosphoribosylaminoimidazolecarboxamide formyltransferase/IMP cyclohydrolase [Ignavibacteriaceae bacterium]|nr:bifunctional phosphoribosylaminoimidazolecarboxamide formyltransferase/IMP cyclohydrolase [Ignavibacteriaceae bacterium]